MENKFKEIAEMIIAQSPDFWVKDITDLARAYLDLESKLKERDQVRLWNENEGLKAALESANAEILSQLKHFNEKLNAKDAEIAGWKLKNEALNWPAVEDKINIYKSENKKLTEQLESANAENERLKQELAKLKETNNGR